MVRDCVRWIGCLALVASALTGCRHEADKPEAAPASPLDEAKRLVEDGQADAALAALLAAPQGPENLCLQGIAWAKKAEGAPLPTPALGPDGASATPEFKSEEERAIELFQRALGSNPGLAEAHLGLAELLAPHAIRRYELAAASRRSRRRGDSAPATDPRLSLDAIAQHFRDAAQDQSTALRALDGLARFAARVGRVADREFAYRGLASHDPENPERFVQLAEFLKERGDPLAAIEQYKQALIWEPGASHIKAKIADIYIDQGRQAYEAEQWAVADARFATAKEWVDDPNSPQALRVREYLMKLDAIRRTPGGR